MSLTYDLERHVSDAMQFQHVQQNDTERLLFVTDVRLCLFRRSGTCCVPLWVFLVYTWPERQFLFVRFLLTNKEWERVQPKCATRKPFSYPNIILRFRLQNATTSTLSVSSSNLPNESQTRTTIMVRCNRAQCPRQYTSRTLLVPHFKSTLQKVSCTYLAANRTVQYRCYTLCRIYYGFLLSEVKLYWSFNTSSCTNQHSNRSFCSVTVILGCLMYSCTVSFFDKLKSVVG